VWSADDIVLGFEPRAEAEQFQRELRARRAKFELALHADKTRLPEFGRVAVLNRARWGQGKLATVDCLGFMHGCSRAAKDRFIMQRQTMKKRLRVKLQKIKDELKRRLHEPVPQQGTSLRSVLLGHYRYNGVPLNWSSLAAFHAPVMRLWTPTLCGHSQKGRLTRTRRVRVERIWRPAPHIHHPFLWQCLYVTT
jgi:RNA-directed DNA polymerase